MSRQSQLDIKRLSVIDKHKMLVNPQGFSQKMSMVSKQESFLSSCASDFPNRQARDQLVRDSINLMLEKDQWYPNLALSCSQQSGYKPNASPPLKKFSATNLGPQGKVQKHGASLFVKPVATALFKDNFAGDNASANPKEMKSKFSYMAQPDMDKISQIVDEDLVDNISDRLKNALHNPTPVDYNSHDEMSP